MKGGQHTPTGFSQEFLKFVLKPANYLDGYKSCHTKIEPLYRTTLNGGLQWLHAFFLQSVSFVDHYLSVIGW
jgi:hypothetical protein